jgi:hypothetical protein
MAKRAVPAGYVRTPKGGIAPAIGGQIVGIRANTASLDNLAYGLSELRGEISVRLMNSAMRESVPGAVKTARDLTVSDGGYDKAGKGAEVRRGIRGGMKGQGQAFVSSVNNWYSLRHWGDNQDPTADYRRHGLRGVRVTGHYAARNYFAPGAKEAFVRIGNSGNILLFGRTGPGRTPLIHTRRSTRPTSCTTTGSMIRSSTSSTSALRSASCRNTMAHSTGSKPNTVCSRCKIFLSLVDLYSPDRQQRSNHDSRPQDGRLPHWA